MNLDSHIQINNRRIGPGEPVFIIAELSANHLGKLEMAIQLIDAAKEAGADAVKLQTYTADTLTLNCETDSFRIKGGLWDDQTLYQLYSQASMPWEWQPILIEHARSIGITIFSTPFDPSAVDFLENLNVPAHKVASFELVDLPLITRIANTAKPVIMSTGMASQQEIDEAVETYALAGGQQLALLKCCSAYPAPPEQANLRTIPFLAERCKVPIGLSDHTLGQTVAITAVALGASIIEKHFTLSRGLGGADSAFSMEPDELQSMIRDIRTAEKALGKPSFELSAAEKSNRKLRRSLYIVDEMKAGDIFTDRNVRSIRPADGLHPKYLHSVIGRKATCDLKYGTPLASHHYD